MSADISGLLDGNYCRNMHAYESQKINNTNAWRSVQATLILFISTKHESIR